MFNPDDIVPIIAMVMSEETGVPKEEIDSYTKIPATEKGFMVVARMANFIPCGGGVLVVDVPDMCTVGELATQCAAEMERKAKEQLANPAS